MKIRVTEEPYISTPEGIAVYAQNPSYTRAKGDELLEGVKHEAMDVDPAVGKVYYHARIFRRRSCDNGRTWTEEPDLATESADALSGERRCVPMHILDPGRDVLVSLHSTYDIDPAEPMFQRGNLRQRTYRMHYQFSRDGGQSWTTPKHVIDCREGYNSTRWGPGLEYGRNGGTADLLGWTWLEDGTFVFGLTASNVPAEGDESEFAEEGSWGVVYVGASWNADGTDLQFTIGDIIRLRPSQAAGGCCEPAVTSLGGQRLFTVMRCQGDERKGIYSTRYSTISEDGGMTWSEPKPLLYDNGSTVWTPASLSQFVRMASTGKTYWLANILPGPVHGQMPRYPLAIAEFDVQRCCVLAGTVRVIKDLPAGAPVERRYTNWGSYEDRRTGELVLTLPEQPKHMNFTAMTRPEQFTADCLRFRIAIKD